MLRSAVRLFILHPSAFILLPEWLSALSGYPVAKSLKIRDPNGLASHHF